MNYEGNIENGLKQGDWHFGFLQVVSVKKADMIKGLKMVTGNISTPKEVLGKKEHTNTTAKLVNGNIT